MFLYLIDLYYGLGFESFMEEYLLSCPYVMTKPGDKED